MHSTCNEPAMNFLHLESADKRRTNRSKAFMCANSKQSMEVKSKEKLKPQMQRNTVVVCLKVNDRC